MVERKQDEKGHTECDGISGGKRKDDAHGPDSQCFLPPGKRQARVQDYAQTVDHWATSITHTTYISCKWSLAKCRRDGHMISQTGIIMQKQQFNDQNARYAYTIAD